MDKNRDLYCACLLMFSASEFLFKHDEKFSNHLLDKVRGYMGEIKVDEDLIKEVEDYAKQIEESINQAQTVR